MQKYDPYKHHRRSIRLQGWDYRAAGYYFVTICSFRRENTFGDVVDSAMVLSELGKIIEAEWLQTAVIRDHITLDQFIIMPNHLHGILVFDNPTVGASGSLALEPNTPSTKGRATGTPLQNASLGNVIGQFKSVVTKKYNKLQNNKGIKIWQRGYYERIVRNERELNAIRQYIQENPIRWVEDRDNLEELLGRMNGR